MVSFGQRVLISACFLAFSSAAFGQDFIKFGTGHDSAFWGTTGYNSPPFSTGFPSTLDYLGTSGISQITSLNLNNTNVSDVFNGNYGTFDALVVSEAISSISGTSSTMFADYVNNGGCLILTGAHGSSGTEATFLNAAFGYGMSAVGTNEGVDTFAIQAGATGTAFTGGPASLLATNATGAFGSTPGTTIYDGTVGVGVFTVAQGLGTVVAIGYDYCCSDGTPPTTEQVILDWYEVATRAFG